MKRFNIGIEITEAAAMRALAQGHGEADFTAAETVLWRLTVIADSIGAGRGFRFVSDPLMRPASMDVELITKPSPSCAPIDPDQAGPRIAGSPTSRKIVDGPDIQGAAHQRCAVGLEDTLNNLRHVRLTLAASASSSRGAGGPHHGRAIRCVIYLAGPGRTKPNS
jgi:hypothetical protein